MNASAIAASGSQRTGPMLEVEHLSVHYGQVQALASASVQIGSKEIVCLLGKNGAGKSTLLRAIVGLVPASGGVVRYCGKELGGLPTEDRVRAGMAMVPEGRGVLARMTVLDNLLMGGYLRQTTDNYKDDIEGVFERFPILKERKNQLAGTLSGGEQQMLALARALMSRPTTILLDEPSMGLAPVIVERVFETIQNIHGQGVTVFLVEQNARMALEIASRFYLLDKGKVVRSGNAEELLDESELEKAYLGA